MWNAAFQSNCPKSGTGTLMRCLNLMIPFFIGSDVYYTYIVDNGFWDIRVRQREEDGILFAGRRICTDN